jgi:hypothetical protein
MSESVSLKREYAKWLKKDMFPFSTNPFIYTSNIHGINVGVFLVQTSNIHNNYLHKTKGINNYNSPSSVISFYLKILVKMSPYMFRPCPTDIIRGFFSLKHLYHSKESVNFYNACQVCPKLICHLRSLKTSY